LNEEDGAFVKYTLKIGLVITLCLSGGLAWAASSSALEAGFARKMAKKHGFDAKQVIALLKQAKRKQKILDAIDRPAESKPWYVYRGYFIKKQQILNGVKFWDKHQAELERAEKKFGVDQEIILGIIGVETRFGSLSGGYRVIDALYTLGFHYPRRGEYFRTEMEQFLLMAKEEGFDPLKVEGSYAGAIGLPQFMPSSYRRYSVDFNGDGKRDLFGSAEDAIDSVANYLKRHGWQAGQDIAIPAKVRGKRYRKVIKWGIKPKKTVLQLSKYGIRPIAAAHNDLHASVFLLRSKLGRDYWLGLKNFYVITRYNRSNLYAMAVTQLGRQVRQKRIQLRTKKQTKSHSR